MEARSFKLRKLDEASGSKQSKRQFTLKRKTLPQNSRKHEQKFSSRPPLTPLHRLKRFKAIRDKNLLKKATRKMEEKLTITEESVGIDSIKSSSCEKLEKINGQQEENISEKQLTNGGSNVSNGHEVNSEKISHDGEINGKQDTKDEDISSSISKESTSYKEVSNELEPNSLSIKQDDEQHNNNSALDEEDSKSQSGDDNLPVNDCHLNVDDNTLSKELLKKYEENDGSTCSSSTFSSSKRLLSSLEDISEPNQSPNENTEEEESEEENDRLSNRDNESEKEKNNDLLREPLLPPEEVKIHQIPSKIPRSISNASSYKSTYGSFQSITGRRAVRTYYRSSDSRKRKADELETSREGNSGDSPSQLSPRWRYFPSSISKLWSPRATPFVFSDSSTPLKNFNDSMTVNVDDNTINYHLNDSDLFSDTREMPTSNKRARWGCSIM